MVGHCGGAPGAGAASAARHRSACRSEPGPVAGGQPQISRGSTRARRTEPHQPVPAHRLLQPGVHCQPPARHHSPAQPRPPRCTSSLTSTAHSSHCAGAPDAAFARTSQVNFADLQSTHSPQEWHTAPRAPTASPAAGRAQSPLPMPPRRQPARPSALQLSRAAASAL